MTTAVPETKELEPGVPVPVAEAVQPTPSRELELTGKVIDGKYRVEAVIGKGGMARIYRATHTGLHRRVALKVMHPHLTDNDTAAVRFEREAYSASRLRHPNCMQVTDFGRTPEGLLYMTMELLEGQELAGIMGRPHAPARATMLMVQIFRGLQHAHENGIVHRDLKPQNIFLTRDHEGREILKIVDFGLAKILASDTMDPNFTQYGVIFGTPLYMSPEQAIGSDEVDGRSDLYSAGCIFYQLLAGQTPFTAREPLALLHQHVSAEPPPLPRSVPKHLRRVVEILLSKHRDHRFGSAGEVLDVLNPRRGQRRPKVPDPARRRKTMPPTDPAGIQLAAALEKVSANPELLRVDGSESVTPVPLPGGAGPPSPISGPSIQVARLRPEQSTSYRAPRDFSWVAPLLTVAVLVGIWSTRRLWLGDVDVPPVSVAGFAVRSSHVSLAVWIMAGLIGYGLWRRART